MGYVSDSSGSGWVYDNYNNWNTNSNISSQHLQNICNPNLGDIPKNKHIQQALVKYYNNNIWRRLNRQEKMKRSNNLYNTIIIIENLKLADKKASKGKVKYFDVIEHNKNKEDNIIKLYETLSSKTYKTSKYKVFKVFEPKERDVYKLPYYPCRIVHHAIMNILEPIWVKSFTSDTYSCIKNKGIHAVVNKLKKTLKDKQNTTYCLKLDIKKFYPSINHDILKTIIRRKIKDKDLLLLLDEIIDSVDSGVPIGNLMSQYFANLYLSQFDHWLKEKVKIKYYFRYADDIVILSDNKPDLHKILYEIKDYLTINLKLEVKSNYQIFPVSNRGIDFVGYKFYHSHILVRKTIKKSCFKRLNRKNVSSYIGWLKHANSKNLINKLSKMKKFSDLNIKPKPKSFSGAKKKIDEIINLEIEVHDFKITASKFKGRCLKLDIKTELDKHIVFTGSENLIGTFEQVNKLSLPFSTTITKEYGSYILN